MKRGAVVAFDIGPVEIEAGRGHWCEKAEPPMQRGGDPRVIALMQLGAGPAL